MTEEKTPSPKSFGDRAAKMVQEFEITKANTLTAVEGCLNRLQEQFGLSDITNGELAWLKGTLGNKLYHINPTKRIRQKNILKKRTWAEWRKTTNDSDETWRNWRKVADKFTRAQARKTGRSGMYQIIREEAKKLAAENKNSTTPNKKLNPPVRTRKHICIQQLPDSWTVVTDELEHMTNLETAPDRFDDPKDKLAKLEAQEANIKTVRRLLKNIENAIRKTQRELRQYISNPKAFQTPDKKDFFTIMIPAEEAAAMEAANKEKAKARAGWMNPDSPAAQKIRAKAIAAKA